MIAIGTANPISSSHSNDMSAVYGGTNLWQATRNSIGRRHVMCKCERSSTTISDPSTKSTVVIAIAAYY
jgi:hypothetical protein